MAARRELNLDKLMEEPSARALAEHDTEMRLRTRAATPHWPCWTNWTARKRKTLDAASVDSGTRSYRGTTAGAAGIARTSTRNFRTEK